MGFLGCVRCTLIVLFGEGVCAWLQLDITLTQLRGCVGKAAFSCCTLSLGMGLVRSALLVSRTLDDELKCETQYRCVGSSSALAQSITVNLFPPEIRLAY